MQVQATLGREEIGTKISTSLGKKASYYAIFDGTSTNIN